MSYFVCLLYHPTNAFTSSSERPSAVSLASAEAFAVIGA
jgi:hypothetical protein